MAEKKTEADQELQKLRNVGKLLSGQTFAGAAKLVGEAMPSAFLFSRSFSFGRVLQSEAPPAPDDTYPLGPVPDGEGVGINPEVLADITPQPTDVEESGSNESSQEMLSASALAEKFDVDYERLRKRLARFVALNDVGWVEVTERRPREPKFLYSVSAVESIIDELKTSSERPAKKNI